MTTSAVTTSQVVGVSGQALERGIDALADLVRGDVEPSHFLRQLLRLTIHTARADEAAAWLRTSEGTWNRLALAVSSSDGLPQSEIVSSPPEFVVEALSSTGPQTTRSLVNAIPTVRLAVAIRQGGQATGIVESSWDATTFAAAAATLTPYLGAVAELTGEFLVQHELRRLRQERVERRAWEDFFTQASACTTLQSLADLSTHEGRRLTGSDRVSVLDWNAGRARVLSVSGVDLVDSRSTSVQALEALAERLAEQVTDDVAFPSPSETEDGTSAWNAYRQLSHAEALCAGIFRIPGEPATGIVIAEKFEPAPAGWNVACQSLRRWISPAWVALFERQRPWWARTRRAATPSTAFFRQAWLVLTIVGASLLALAVIPARLEVSGQGRLLPEQRRDLFASTTGVVAALHATHGQNVTAGEVLVVLRDPQSELEATRIAGDLATVRTRLTVIQAARIGSAASGNDSVARAQQLAGEEEELKQRQTSLQRQQALLQDEQRAWNLSSPIAGQVLTWDVETLLEGRPVERGQTLLTVGDVAGDWIVEAQFRERDLQHLWSATSDGPVGARVRFVPAANSERVCEGTVRDVARTMDIDERGDSTVRVTIAFDKSQLEQLRPGTTVLPRINCGWRSLGYVWLHDAIDAIRRQWWQW